MLQGLLGRPIVGGEGRVSGWGRGDGTDVGGRTYDEEDWDAEDSSHGGKRKGGMEGDLGW